MARKVKFTPPRVIREHHTFEHYVWVDGEFVARVSNRLQQIQAAFGRVVKVRRAKTPFGRAFYVDCVSQPAEVAE